MPMASAALFLGEFGKTTGMDSRRDETVMKEWDRAP
jgi:hypothetical protein